MAATVSDAQSRRLDQVARDRQQEARDRQRTLDRALADAERREWSQKRYGHEQGR